MSISDYTAELESVINSSTIASSYNLNIDHKTADIAFISGRIDFRDVKEKRKKGRVFILSN